MRNRRNKRTNNVKNKGIKIIVSLFSIIALIIFSVIFSLLNMTNTKIINGIKIEEIDVSGLSGEEANEKIKEWYKNTVEKNITLKYQDIEEEININEFEAKVDIDKVISQALKMGREGNILENNYTILLTMLFHKDLNINLEYNQEKLDNKLEEISGKLPGSVIENSYYIDLDELIIKKGTDGIKVELDDLKKQVKDCIKKDGDKIIEIPIKQTSPEPIDIEKIYREIYKEAQNAIIEENPTKVYPQVDGVDFAVTIEEAKKIVEQDKDEYVIPLNITLPKVTLDSLGEKAFPEKLSEFITRYDASNENRSTNIALASERIDGTIVKPGETFSYNKIVGERTLSKGYKEATVFVGGKLVQGVGGGICQLSSTLYNAALYANMEVTKRSNHRFLTSYVSAGRDATVSWGTIDFCFVNTRRYPVKIVSRAQNGIIKVQFYGIKEEEEYEVEIQTKILEETDYDTKFINDYETEEGINHIKQYGSNAVKSETYKILKLNGNIVSKTLLSTDTYSALDKIIIRGAKEVTEKVNEPEETIDENAEEIKDITFPVVSSDGSVWGNI